jgi:hypothetical protein
MSDEGERRFSIPGRTHERNAGCWNCSGWDHDGKLTMSHWKACKARDLAKAKIVEQRDPRGRNSPQALQIRRVVADAEPAIKAGRFRLCLVGGGGAVGFVQSGFLCEDPCKWNAAQGASVGIAGEKLNVSPKELKDIVDGSGE